MDEAECPVTTVCETDRALSIKTLPLVNWDPENGMPCCLGGGLFLYYSNCVCSQGKDLGERPVQRIIGDDFVGLWRKKNCLWILHSLQKQVADA